MTYIFNFCIDITVYIYPFTTSFFFQKGLILLILEMQLLLVKLQIPLLHLCTLCTIHKAKCILLWEILKENLFFLHNINLYWQYSYQLRNKFQESIYYFEISNAVKNGPFKLIYRCTMAFSYWKITA